MEEVTEAISNLTRSDTHKKYQIQVSNTKQPLLFYVNLAKRYMQQHNEVELSTPEMVSSVQSTNGCLGDQFRSGMSHEEDNLISNSCRYIQELHEK